MRPVLPAIIAVFLIFSSAAAKEKTDITIYGKAILSADYYDNGDYGSLGITSSNSRLGFKGYFVLRENLRAIWQIESRVDLDISGSVFASRNSFFGFTGNFGSLKLGRHDTPFKMANQKIDAFLNRIGDSRNIVGTYAEGFDLRANSMALYESPDIYNIETKILYKTESGYEGTDLISGSVSYEGHGLNLWAAGEAHGRMITAVNDTTPSDKSEYGLRFSGAWSRNVYTFFGMIEGIRNFNGIGGVSKNSLTLGVRWYINESWNLRTKYVGTGGRSDVEQSAGNMFAASIDRNFTESAIFFLAVAVTFNEENAEYAMISPGLFMEFVPLPGKDPWGISLGTLLAF